MQFLAFFDIISMLHTDSLRNTKELSRVRVFWVTSEKVYIYEITTNLSLLKFNLSFNCTCYF